MATVLVSGLLNTMSSNRSSSSEPMATTFPTPESGAQVTATFWGQLETAGSNGVDGTTPTARLWVGWPNTSPMPPGRVANSSAVTPGQFPTSGLKVPGTPVATRNGDIAPGAAANTRFPSPKLPATTSAPSDEPAGPRTLASIERPLDVTCHISTPPEHEPGMKHPSSGVPTATSRFVPSTTAESDESSRLNVPASVMGGRLLKMTAPASGATVAMVFVAQATALPAPENTSGSSLVFEKMLLRPGAPVTSASPQLAREAPKRAPASGPSARATASIRAATGATPTPGEHESTTTQVASAILTGPALSGVRRRRRTKTSASGFQAARSGSGAAGVPSRCIRATRAHRPVHRRSAARRRPAPHGSSRRSTRGHHFGLAFRARRRPR